VQRIEHHHPGNERYSIVNGFATSRSPGRPATSPLRTSPQPWLAPLFSSAIFCHSCFRSSGISRTGLRQGHGIRLLDHDIMLLSQVSSGPGSRCGYAHHGLTRASALRVTASAMVNMLCRSHAGASPIEESRTFNAHTGGPRFQYLDLR